ncbi:MAG TPA: HAD-IC family P-type ATPase [Thermoanaerobaculia bacterium]|nr:HAD-IC family P-type ATPase [Thermoanaerobaculia bacterium]
MTRRERPAPAAQETPAWHALPPEEVVAALGSSPTGLDDGEAARRLGEFGPNLLPTRPPPTLLAIVLHQFKSPLIYVLLAAAAVALVLGDTTDAGFILLVVLLNAALGTFQEWRAERSAAGLQRLLGSSARVIRGASDRRLPAEDLVPGDLVALESGDRVPADVRLLQVNNLSVDQSFLTGESLPVAKQVAAIAEDAPVSDRRSVAFAGSTVMSGRARAVVVATGLRTEVGTIAESVSQADTAKPPLVVRMEAFARQISLIVLAACVGLAVVAAVRGMPWLDVFFLAVALAVSAIPEGLPVAMTVALSIATTRMAARKVIVRRLTAVEGLGSCTYIATDKTGTLTVNRQTVRLLSLPGGTRIRVSGEGYAGDGELCAEDGGDLPAGTRERAERLARTVVVCNEASLRRQNGQWHHRGDAVDVALLALGYKAGMSPEAVRGDLRIVGEIPFESERSYAATFYERESGIRVAVKGALEVVLPRCAEQLGERGPGPTDAAAIERDALDLSERGYRLITVAEGEAGEPNGDRARGEDDLPSLTLLGVVGLIDPPRPEAAEAVAKCQQAGIVVAMVTGDHPATALAIARELGIAESDEEAVTGRELAELGDAEQPGFVEAVDTKRVFARMTPLQKLHIVDALIRLGHFVAVTGDGVNDAPALRKANIGVAMGSGTDVAKDTAEIIVADDNFASIEAGVEEGRFAYDNVRKVTYLLISTGAAEVLLFTLALATGLPLPLLPVQILWLNLVTNGIQDVALAFEGGEPGAMARPPRRPREGIFDRLMIQQTVLAGAAMGLLAFVNWRALLDSGFSEVEARARLLLLFVLMQNFHVFNCRSETVSAFRVPLRRNPALAIGVPAALGIHLLATYLPMLQGILQIQPIALREWPVLIGMAAAILAAMELYKLWRARSRASRAG